nr:helix-turn-helix transcriptional regulator [Bifidobacterium cuniculi]
MLKNKGVSYRAMESLTGGKISYSRVNDICTERRAPVKLSELITICDGLDEDPADAVQQIIDTARTMQAAADSPTVDPAHLDPSNPAHVQWIADHADLFDATAKKGDTQAEQEGMEELP